MWSSTPLGYGIPLTWVRDGQTLLGSNAGTVPLTIKGASGQTANVFQVVDSNGVALLTVDKDGNLTVKGSDNVTINDSITGNLTVNGVSTFVGAVTAAVVNITGLLTATGNQTFGTATTTMRVVGALVVDGAMTLNGGLSVGGDLSATTFNGVTITRPTISATLTLVTGSSLITSGANAITLTSTGATNVTLPTSGTLANLIGVQTFSNKVIDNSNTVTLKDTLFTLQDDGDTTKQLTFQLSGIATLTTRTITMPDASGTVTLLGNAATGTGSVVLANTPTLITPVLGVATATSINSLTISTSTGTLTITNAKTLSISNTLTLAGTDGTTMTFPTTSATIARTDAGQTFTGVNIFTSPKILTDISDTNGNELIKFTATGSAVNEVTITNAATGTAGPTIAASGETNVDLKMAGKGTGKIHNTTGTYGDITAYSPGAAGTATLTFQTSNIHSITMPAGNITIAFSNDSVGQCVMIDILQDGTGSRTVTWPAGIKWAGGSAPTLTTTASKIDKLGIEVITAGSAYHGVIIGANV